MFKMFFCENKSLNYVVLFCLSVAEAIMRIRLLLKRLVPVIFPIIMGIFKVTSTYSRLNPPN